MKRCPECRRDYYDDTLLYCLDDGTPLLDGPASMDEPATAILSEPGAIATGFRGGEDKTRPQILTTDQTAIFLRGAEAEPQKKLADSSERQSLSAHRVAEPQEGAINAARPLSGRAKLLAGIGLVVLLLVAGFFGYRYLGSNTKQIESIAVMPFVNESGNADVEYLSDGMTETLINSISQVPNLNVKARSSVFRYKGKDTDAQIIGKELDVQAILNGRVVQRGDDLVLYLELVDAQTGNRIWGDQYNKKLINLVSLQTDIARDVSQKIKTKLSGADEQKLAKNYTENAEAYQLYLKGRFHFLKTTRVGFQTAIPLFQKAIEIDLAYALAYAGLADAYRSLALAGEIPANEVMPKGKAAANKALEIDETLAEAHAILGYIIFWYDWDWKAAENQFKRALELNPDNADTHLFYANLLSNTERHAEAVAETKKALELDPLNLRVNGLSARFLAVAGQPDEALKLLQKTFELDPNYWLAHQSATIAYLKKGMYAEAANAGRKALQNYDNTRNIAFLGYALAKEGKTAEARAELVKLLQLSREGYLPPINIATIYSGLNEREEALKWLERGIEQRDPRMTFLKVEPQWDNLRDDPRFKDLLRRIGLPQ